jgi:hypothetical protein
MRFNRVSHCCRSVTSLLCSCNIGPPPILSPLLASLSSALIPQAINSSPDAAGDAISALRARLRPLAPRPNAPVSLAVTPSPSRSRRARPCPRRLLKRLQLQVSTVPLASYRALQSPPVNPSDLQATFGLDLSRGSRVRAAEPTRLRVQVCNQRPLFADLVMPRLTSWRSVVTRHPFV